MGAGGRHISTETEDNNRMPAAVLQPAHNTDSTVGSRGQRLWRNTHACIHAHAYAHAHTHTHTHTHTHNSLASGTPSPVLKYLSVAKHDILHQVF